MPQEHFVKQSLSVSGYGKQQQRSAGTCGGDIQSPFVYCIFVIVIVGFIVDFAVLFGCFYR